MTVLAEICQFIVDCEHKTAPLEAEGIPSIRTPNIGRGYFLLDGVNRVSEETYVAWTRRAVPSPGDLVLAREAPVGNVAVIPPGERFCLGQRTVLIRPDLACVDSDYLCYLLLTPRLQAQLLSKSGGATVHHLNMKDIRSLELPELPTLPVQRRASGVVRAYEDLIAANQRRIALLEEAARRLYREWFVHLRFPGHESVRMNDAVPEGWRRAPLDEALFLQRGFDLPATDRLPGDVPVYASTGLNGFHDRAKVGGPGVVTGRSGTLGLVHYVREDFWPLNTALWVKEFRAVSPLLAYFMLQELQLDQFNAGASVPTLDRKVAHQLSVMIPARNVVTAFDAKVQPLFDQVQVLLGAIKTASRARDLLLPKLMSGELDVSGIRLPEEAAA
jgi:type I restriction enzyme, S subunit